MAIQRVPGQMLDPNLLRTTNLDFSSPTLTGILHLDVSNNRVGIKTDAPGNFALDVNGTAHFRDSVSITGDLTVTGQTTVVSTTNMEIEDNILVLNSGGSTGNDAGIMINRNGIADNAVFYWDEVDDKFKFVITPSDGSTVTSVDDSILARIAVATPIDGDDAVTKNYVDSAISGVAGSFNIADDGSTTSNVLLNDTLQFLGGNNIATTVSDNTVTFTGSKDININSITSDDSTAIQINDGLNVAGNIDMQGNSIVGVADPNNAQDVATKAYVDAQNQSQALTFVGDDSTGTLVSSGETFKVAGATGITTAVSGDTLTITGPDLSSFATTSYVDAQNVAQSLTFVGDDSTGTTVSSGETFKVAGTGGVTAIVTGDTLTIDGSAVAADLGTFTFSGNKITQTASNADFEIDNAGSGNFTMLGTSALVIPKGTVAERPSSIVAGSIRYNTDNSVYEISEDGNTWLPIKTGTANDTVTNNTVLKTLEYNKLTTSSTVVDEFDQYSTGGAFYHIGIEDISNNLVGQLNINIVHDTAGNAYHTVYDANEDSTDLVSWSTNVSGNNIQLVAQANSSSHVNLKIQKISLSAIDNKLNFTNSSVTTVAEIVSGAKKIISFPLDGFTSAKIYTLFQNTDNNAYEVRELLVARTGTNVYLTGYGNVLTASAPLATYTALVVGTEVIISASNNGGGEGTITAYSMQVGTGTSIGSYNNVTYNKVGDVDTTNAITVDSFAVASRRTAKYIVNLHNTAGLVQTSEISLIHNGSDAYITEQSISSGTSLGTFTADVNNGRARLRVQGSGHQNTSIVFARFDYEQSMFYKADGDTTGVVRTYGTSALHLPVGTTAQRPSAAAGIIRFNSTTSKYEVSLNSSTWVALKTEATIRPVTKDVFLGDGSTQTFTSANVDTDEENLLVYIDGVVQEPTENYTTNIGASTVTITDEPPHAGARIIIIRGFAEDLA